MNKEISEAAYDCQSYTYEDIQESGNFLLKNTKYRPAIGVICGSGIGSLAESLTNKECFPYKKIPHFPVSTVRGHMCQLVFGLLDGVPVMCMQGRCHYYEGLPISKCAMPVRVMKMVGVKYLIATNAAGGINENYKVGDIMVVKDHVNFMGLAGVNPLRGFNDDRFGSRFPSVSRAYDIALRALAKKIGTEMGIENYIHEGVLSCAGGPSYETVTELRAMKLLGIDAAGMSIAHEVIVACQSGMTVFAFSLITNKCPTTYDSTQVPDHEEVMKVGNSRENMLKEFVSRMVLHMQCNEEK